MAFQREQGIPDHFLSQFRLHFHFDEPALRVRIPRFVLFCLFFKFVYNLYFLVYKVVAVYHDHHQHEKQQEIPIMGLYFVPVQKISLYNVYKSQFLLWFICRSFCQCIFTY